MKYAIVNIERRRIRRINDTQPQNLLEDLEAVEISNQQATDFESMQKPVFLVEGELMTLLEKRELDRVAALTLAEQKLEKIQALKQERDAAWQGTLMTSFGVPFHTDVQTQIDIQMMLQMLAPKEIFAGYKCADGVRRDLSREQFALALNEGVVRKVTAFAIEGAKLEAVEAATTADQIAAISW